jgi:hypothetical protein
LLNEVQDIESNKSVEIQILNESLAKLGEEKNNLGHQSQEVFNKNTELEHSYQDALIKLETVEKQKVELEEANLNKVQELQAIIDQKTSEFETSQQVLETKLHEQNEEFSLKIADFNKKFEENEQKFQVNIFDICCVVVLVIVLVIWKRNACDCKNALNSFYRICQGYRVSYFNRKVLLKLSPSLTKKNFLY